MPKKEKKKTQKKSGQSPPVDKPSTTKKTRRSQNKFPALDPHLNLKSRQELIDYDYLKKLSPKEKAWLNKFTQEYVNDVVDRKNLDNNLHNTKALKKDCDDRNNSRNRCILTQQKSMGKLNYIEELVETPVETEDSLIDKLDKEINE